MGLSVFFSSSFLAGARIRTLLQRLLKPAVHQSLPRRKRPLQHKSQKNQPMLSRSNRLNSLRQRQQKKRRKKRKFLSSIFCV
jgi:hypothetical protein